MKDITCLGRILACYLDWMDYFLIVEEICKNYNKTSQFFINFLIEIDAVDLINYNSELGDICLNDHLKFGSLIKDILYSYMHSNNIIKINYNQIITEVSIQNLPSLPQLLIQKIDDLINVCDNLTYVKLSGIVLSIKKMGIYVKATKYVCVSEKCKQISFNNYIRIYTQGIINKITRKDFICTYCGKFLKEDLTTRVIGEKYSIKLISNSVFNDEHSNVDAPMLSRYIKQVIVVDVNEKLIKHIGLGKTYTVVGFPKKCYKDISDPSSLYKVIIEANSIVPLMHLSSLHGNKNTPKPEEKGDIFKKLLNLKTRSKYPLWDFFYYLGWNYANKICPPGTLLRLKMGIVLTFLFESTGFLKPGIMGVGDDGNLMNRLFRYSVSYLSSISGHHIHSINDKLIYDIDKTNDKGNSVCAGSMYLAGEGICYIGKWDKVTKKDKELLHLVMENNSSMLDHVNNKIQSDQAPDLFINNINCSLWAYVETKCKFLHGMKHPTIHTSDHSLISLPIRDYFGMIYYTQNLVEGESLTNGVQNYDAFLSDEEIFSLLSIAKARPKIELTDAAKTLLKTYFLYSRRMWLEENFEYEFPKSATKIILQLSRAMVRISLQEEVTGEILSIAICFYEEYILSQFNKSVLLEETIFHNYDGRPSISDMKRHHNIAKFLNKLLDM